MQLSVSVKKQQLLTLLSLSQADRMELSKPGIAQLFHIVAV